MRKLLLALLAVPALWGQLQPFTSVSFPSQPSGWTSTGAWPAGSVFSASVDQTMQYTGTLPTGYDYEIRPTYRITGSGGSLYTILRGTPGVKVSGAGTMYMVEVMPTFQGTQCSAHVSLLKVVNSVWTAMGYTETSCEDNMQLRIVVRSNWIYVRDEQHDLPLLFGADNPPFTGGQPGIGVHSVPGGVNNGIAAVAVYPLDSVVPDTVGPPAVSARSNRVELQWGQFSDPAPSSLRDAYYVQRVNPDGTVSAMNYARSAYYADSSVQPATTYTYRLYQVDVHQNYSAPRSIDVRTAPAGADEPRRTGLRPEGTYWGGAGEQIDAQSGNLNYTLPLIAAKGRAGLGMTFSLNYNSQNWRRDGSNIWHYGYDTGFGYGWRLQAGSLIPIWADNMLLYGYLFRDSTGAEYRLNTSAPDPADSRYRIWTSGEGIFVTYEERTKRLYFNDGKFWLMDVESAAGEQDAGTLYPSMFQDTNGNQVKIDYAAGIGGWAASSSSRPLAVRDGVNGGAVSYTFTYAGLNLVSITGGGSTVTLNYSTSAVAIVPPWSAPNYAVGAARLLTSVSRTDGGTHSFEYVPSSAATTGELQRVTLPYGGKIRWTYREFTFVGDRTIREIQDRYLQQNAGDTTETSHSFWRNDAADAGQQWHIVAALNASTGQKVWYFTPDRKISQFEERTAGGVARRIATYTWSTGANAYINKSVSKLYGTQSTAGPALTTVTEQLQDIYGNVNWTKVRDGDPGTAERQTSFEYLHEVSPNASQYLSRYIRNRLTKVTVTATGGQTFIPFTASYDTAAIVNDVPAVPTGYTVPPGPQPLPLHDSVTFTNTFNWRGNATVVTKGGVSTSVSQIDRAGMVRQSSGPNGTVTVSPNPNWGWYGMAAPGVQLNGVQTSLTYDGMVRLTSATGPDGTAGFTWDAAGRPTSRTMPDGSSATISYSFSPAVTTERSGKRWTKSYLDGLGRNVKVETGKGAGTQAAPDVTESVIESVYAPCACTPLGKVSKASRPRSATDSTVAWTVYSYDELGRTTSIVHAPASGTTGNSGTTLYEYDVQAAGPRAITKVTDPAGRWKSMLTSAWGDLTEQVEPTANGSGVYQTSYGYNALGKMIAVYMPRDNTTQTRSFEYFDDGTLKATVHPESGRTDYTWTQGNLATKTTGSGTAYKRESYIYGANMRLSEAQRLTATSVSGPWTENTSEKATYSYYPSGHLQVLTYGGGQVTENYGYTAAGQLATKQLVSPWGTLTASWTYTADGKVDTLTYPSSTANQPRVDKYEYNDADRNNRVRDPNNCHLELGTTVCAERYSAGYDFIGRMTAMEATNLSQSWQYNGLGQMTGYTLWTGYNTGVSVGYDYGASPAAGKVMTSSMALNQSAPVTTIYTYDQLGRLSSATAPTWSQTYTYDGFTRLTGTQSTGEAAAVVTPNVTAGAPDESDRLTSVDGAIAVYDESNQRVLRIRTPGTSGFNSPEVHEVTFWVGGQRLGVYQYTRNEYTQGWDLTTYREWGRIGGRMVRPMDRLGSDLSAGRRFLPYGQELGVAPGATNSGWGGGLDGHRFATYWREESGIDYAINRYYNPGTGAFLTADPYGDNWDPANPASWNDYAYVNGDPINYNDPEGLDCRTVRLFGWAGIPDRTTVDSLLSQSSDLAILTKTVFAEARVGWDDNAAREKSAIASVIMNRWQIVNGYWLLFNSAIEGRSGEVRTVPDWGRPDGTVASIVYSGQFQVWASPGVMASDSQARLDRALRADEDSDDCVSLLQSIGTAAGFWSARNQHNLYTDEATGLIFTGFQSALPGRAAQKSYYETWIGSYGSGNVFSGVAAGQVWLKSVPLPPRPQRPPSRRGR